MVRKMVIGDYEKVYNLWAHTAGMGLNTTDDSKEGIARYLARNPNTCFVAELEGELIGVIMSGHDGEKLVRSALAALEQEGIHKVALVVFGKNKTGNSFWEKMGFTVRDDLAYRNKNIHELERIDL